MLVVMTGLPATGKSAVGEAVARAIPAPCFSVDPLEATLLRLGITREQQSDVGAYDLAYTLATSQLQLGQSAVVDAVNGYPPVQVAWAELAAEQSVPLVVIQTVCTDRDVHRQRASNRARNIEGFVYEPSWSDIEHMQASWYVPFPNPDIVLDAVEPLERNLDRAVALVDTVRRISRAR